MAQEWYYAQGDRKVGPISEAELKELAATGKLSAGDLVWKDGLPDWRPAGRLKGLPFRPGGPPPIPSGGEGRRPSPADVVGDLTDRVGFLDLTFRQFATPHLIGVVFTLALLVLAGSFVYWTDYALGTFVAKKAAFAIVLLVITHGFLAVGLRVSLELCVVVFRIAEHLSHLRHLGDGREGK
jgi:hypothetical protein